MWFAVRDLFIEWTFNNVDINIVYFCLIFITAFGIVREYSQRRRESLMKKAAADSFRHKSKMIRKSKSEQSFNELLNGDKVLSHYYMNNKEGKQLLIEDSMLYKKVTQRSKEIGILSSLRCNCEGSIERCSHNKCKTCCDLNGWCKKNVRDRPSIMTLHKSKSVEGNEGLPCVKISRRPVQTNSDHIGFEFMDAKRLDVSHNAMNRIPDDMAVMRLLEDLNLSSNLLTKIPMFFSNFRQLSLLDVRCNTLTEFPSPFLELRNLQTLLLDCNHILFIPREISTLRNLEILGLGHNDISDIPSSLFTIVRLQFLRLSGNLKLNSIPPEVCQAFALEQLEVSKCNLRFVPISLGRCAFLHTLILSDNRLKYLPCEISQCLRLKNLILDNNPLKNLPAALHYFGQRLSIKANCSSLFKAPYHNGWELIDIQPPRPVKSALSLSYLARVSVKKYGICYSELPYGSQEELSSYSSCFFCGCKGMIESVRVVKRTSVGGLGGPEYPFSYTFCLEHIQLEEPIEKLFVQINTLILIMAAHGAMTELYF